MCNSIKPTLEVIHPAWEQTILHDCVCLWERHPSACALLSGELISPIPGMSRHSQGKHSRFNYKLQRGLVCAALCVSVRLWEWGRHKGREWQKVSPSFPALTNKTGTHTHSCLTWAVWGTVGLFLHTGGQGESRLLWVPSVRKNRTSNVSKQIKMAQTPNNEPWKSPERINVLGLFKELNPAVQTTHVLRLHV